MRQTYPPPTTMNRDPHLPPPEVVDWLVEQDWSDMIPVSLIQYHGSAPHGITQSKLYEYQQAHAELGSDDSARILIPVETLEVLKADQKARRETTLPDPNRPLHPGGIVINGEDTGHPLLEAICTLRKIANSGHGLSWCRSKAREMLKRVQQTGEVQP